MAVQLIEIDNCHNCPFIYWSDHAIPPEDAPGYYDRGGEICSLDNRIRIPVGDDSSFTDVHARCPLRDCALTKVYSIKE